MSLWKSWSYSDVFWVVGHCFLMFFFPILFIPISFYLGAKGEEEIGQFSYVVTMWRWHWYDILKGSLGQHSWEQDL